MKIYDISQELLGSVVYPGDPAPERQQVMDITHGDVCNLSTLSLCAHNGTHIDAPYHFLASGKTVDQLGLSTLVGKAKVVKCSGLLSAADVEQMMADAPARILLKGDAIVTLEAAKAFNDYGVQLIGVESQSVGPKDAPMAVHLELLGKDVVLLEGIRLDQVPEGNYILNAAPINIGGADGAPCRAILMDMEEE